jgi:hypothetical protein
MLLVVAWNEMNRRQHVRKISVELQNEYSTHSTDDERQPTRWSQRNRRIDARKSAQDERLMFFRSWFQRAMDGGLHEIKLIP